jgi:xylulose-5-phosphate/fructose-6-phosphate phosphoketolase
MRPALAGSPLERSSAPTAARRYKEKSNLNTPMEVDYQSDRSFWLGDSNHPTAHHRRFGLRRKTKYRNHEIDCRIYAFKYGIDKPEIVA